MAGEKANRKRSSASVLQDRRGGDEVAPKIRKIAQEDTVKREGKLQVKGKMRRLEEKAEEVAATPMDEEAAAADGHPAVEKDCDGMFPEHAAPLFPGAGGAAQLDEVNAVVRTSIGEFEDSAEDKGYLDCYNPDTNSKLPSYAQAIDLPSS